MSGAEWTLRILSGHPHSVMRLIWVGLHLGAPANPSALPGVIESGGLHGCIGGFPIETISGLILKVRFPRRTFSAMTL